MELTLSQNIRKFRKERQLTQEQLAEIMGVTLGAVYKWESGQSIPELKLIVKMADFFGTSTDVLIGYTRHSSSAEKTQAELKRFRTEKDYENGSDAAYKALQNYPNHFEIVYECAMFFYEKAELLRTQSDYETALRQMNRACELISQNTDESISELSIRSRIAQIYFELGQTDACLKILKRYNSCGINDAKIGCILSDCYHQTEQAKPYLQKAFARLLNDMDPVITGFATIFLWERDFSALLSGIEWLRMVLRGGEPAEHVIGFDQYDCVLLAIEAEVYCMLNDETSAEAKLHQAAVLAKRFDDIPPDAVCEPQLFEKLGAESKQYTVYGSTARQALETRIQIDAEAVPQFLPLWEKVKSEVSRR